MTKQNALNTFRENILPDIITKYGKNDIPAKREAWNDYTDSLCKSGLITDEQYSNWSNPF